MKSGAGRIAGLAAWALLALAVELAAFTLAGGPEGILGFPIHHDDFRNLSYTSFGQLPPLGSPRPVSNLVLGLLSIAGPSVYYGALHLLVAAYVVLVVSFARRLFPSTGWPAVLTTCAALSAALLFERTPEYALYSGLVTNLVSAVIAMGSLLALEAEPSSRRGRIVSSLAAVGLFATALLAKEDFALAIVLGFTLRAVERHLEGDRRRQWRDALLLLMLLLVSVGFLGWTFGAGRSAFLHGSGPYESVFAPVSLVRTTIRYLLCTPGAQIATAIQAAVLALAWLTGDRRMARRLAGLAAVTLALIVPYAALPHHFSSYYAFNWTVWQAATLVALGPIFRLVPRPARVLLAGGVVALVGGWAAITHSARVSLVRWYEAEAGRNRAILRSLTDLRGTLRPWPVVGVTGVMPLNPWFANDGEYFRRRLGLTNRWVIFAAPDYLERTRTLLGSLRFGSIEVREVRDLAHVRIPLIVLAPDGAGRVTVPGPGTALPSAAARFVARPERLQVCDGSGLGVTRLEWAALVPMEVRVGSPDGPLFAGPALTGSAETGKWVNDGATFFLRGPTGEVAGVVGVRVNAEGCH